jgi:hypothetical protein
MNSPRSALIVLSFLLVAGCVQPANHAATVVTDQQKAVGGVQGFVLDQESVPLANATVAVVAFGLQATTAADGRYSFLDLPVNNYSFVVSHDRYVDGTFAVDVRPDQVAKHNVTLGLLPDYRPFNVTTPLVGQIDCAAEAAIITGPCWTAVEGVSCDPRVNHCTADPVFGSKYQFPFGVNARWDTIIAELVWSAGTNGLDGMRLYVENANTSAQGLHGKGVAKVYGGAKPLVARIDRGTPAPGHEFYDDAKKVPAFVPDDGGPQQVRVFPEGKAYDQTSQQCLGSYGCLLGAGAGMNVRFTVYLTIFYNGAAPKGWTAVPKA